MQASVIVLFEEKRNVKWVPAYCQVCLKTSPSGKKNLSFFPEAERIGIESLRLEMELAERNWMHLLPVQGPLIVFHCFCKSAIYWMQLCS